MSRGLAWRRPVSHSTAPVSSLTRSLQTSNRRIYAAGDICFPFKFTHTADALAQIVIQNALFPHPFGLGTARTSSLIIPWCTYTEPEIAHVGMYEAEARAKGVDVENVHPTTRRGRPSRIGRRNGGVCAGARQEGHRHHSWCDDRCGSRRQSDQRDHRGDESRCRAGSDRRDDPPVSYAV